MLWCHVESANRESNIALYCQVLIKFLFLNFNSIYFKFFNFLFHIFCHNFYGKNRDIVKSTFSVSLGVHRLGVFRQAGRHIFDLLPFNGKFEVNLNEFLYLTNIENILN